METQMNDGDRGRDWRTSPLDEDDPLTDAVKSSFKLWMMTFDIVRGSTDEWVQARAKHLRETGKALNDIQGLPTEQKPSAVANLVYGEVENAIKDLGAAYFRAMALGGATAREMSKDIRKRTRQWGPPG
jgi:hypothetical protein